MRKQTQAEHNLQALSQQLTRYLDDWITNEPVLAQNKPRMYAKISRKCQIDVQQQSKQVIIKPPKQKAEMCRIQFPILEQRSVSSKNLLLPLIEMRKKNFDVCQNKKTRFVSEFKCSKFLLPLDHEDLQRDKCKSNMKAKVHQFSLKNLKKIRSKKLFGSNNPQCTMTKESSEVDVSKIKQAIQKQLKNQRKSAKQKFTKGQ